jgi:AcrR family transcriptional regulator
MKTVMNASPRRSYLISLDHRKRRGSGCERPAEILKAARELFLNQGVENVTTRQIAARVGISQTALYVYFSSKEDMLDALAEEAWGRLADALDGADCAQLGPAERLRAVLAAYMRFWLRNADDFRVIFMRKALRTCHVEAKADLKAKVGLRSDLLDRLAARFREAKRSATAEGAASAEEAALAMWTAVSGAVALRLAFPGLAWPSEEEHIAATVGMILRGCDCQESGPRAKAPEVAVAG